MKTINTIKTWLFLGALSLFFASCQKENNVTPAVTTEEVKVPNYEWVKAGNEWNYDVTGSFVGYPGSFQNGERLKVESNLGNGNYQAVLYVNFAPYHTDTISFVWYQENGILYGKDFVDGSADIVLAHIPTIGEQSYRVTEDDTLFRQVLDTGVVVTGATGTYSCTKTKLYYASGAVGKPYIEEYYNKEAGLVKHRIKIMTEGGLVDYTANLKSKNF